MSNDTNYLTSPKGEIQFMALNRKVSKDMKDDSVQGYVVRLKFNDTTAEGAAWRKTIAAINPNLIGTKNVNNKNEYTVKAFSRYLPEIIDGNGDQLEDIPNFFASSTGTASIVVQPYTGNSLGGTINLAAVVIHDIDVGENSAGTGAEGGREAVLAALKASLKNGG
jgi:hypothetical protein